MMTQVGPGREHAELQPWETDAFTVIVLQQTNNLERVHLSNALRMINAEQTTAVIDGFHRSMLEGMAAD